MASIPAYACSRRSRRCLISCVRIVEQDPKDEPANNLLLRSQEERARLKLDKRKDVRPIPGDTPLGFRLPASWKWESLENLLVFGPTNGVSPKAVDYATNVRSLTLSATTSGQFKAQHFKCIDIDVPNDSELWLRAGDILVQRGNTPEYVGVSAVYRGPPNCFVYPDLMMKLRVSTVFNVEYIHLAMSHEGARNYLRERASGTSGSMPKINQTTLRSLPIPIPPLAEQHRIVAKVEELLALCDRLEAQLTTSQTHSRRLLEATLHQALAPALSDSD